MSTTVAVLLRSDAAFVGIHVGDDWQDAAQRLSLGHCFDMTVPVVFPVAPPDAVEAMKSILAPCLIRNGWYICSVADVCVALLNAMAAPEARGNKRKLAETEEEEAEEAEEEEEKPFESDDEIFEYLQPCERHEADRVTLIRTTLQAKLGKAEAKRILDKTQHVVTRTGGQGKARLLRFGPHFLKARM